MLVPDSSSADLLVRSPLVATCDASEFVDRTQPIFGHMQIDLTEGSRGFAAVANFRRLNGTGVYYGQYARRMQVTIPEAGFLAQGVTLSGNGRHNHGGGEDMLTPNVLPASVLDGTRVKIEFAGGHRHLAFCMPPGVVMEKLHALIGRYPSGKLLFTNGRPPPEKRKRRFQLLLMLLVAELDGADEPSPDIFLTELEQSLIVAFLLANENNFTHFFEDQPPDLAPWQVKRVEQFLEANWDQAISIEAVAAAVDASARSIQHAFKKSRDYSPMEFLRRIRLIHARRMLTAPDPSTTVTDVAYACGFGNLGHFARSYAELFDELPSRTLSHGKSS